MNKQDYQRLLSETVSPLKAYFSDSKTRIRLGCQAYEDIEIQTFARPLWGLVPFWAGGGCDSVLEENFKTGIESGSNPNNPEYWGNCSDFSNRFAEMAAFSYGMLMSPDKIWTPLSEKGKSNLHKWLWQINEHRVCDSEGFLSRLLVNAAFKKLGLKYSPEHIAADIDRLNDFYIQNGWYTNGVQGDYHVSFSIHFYSLIFAKYMENDYPEYSRLFKKRAEIFAQDFIYWFAEDGEALPYGRSLTCRFAQAAFWSACLTADVYPFPVGVIKGIIDRHLAVWYNSNMFDNAHILSVGYKYPNLLVAENCTSPASPYLGLKTFAFLALPDEHEFWSAEPLPLPKLDTLHPIPEADMLISRRGGEVTAYVAGTPKNLSEGQIIPKYLKFAYSTKFGFNVAKSMISLEEAACDSMLCFIIDDLVITRRFTHSYEVEDDCVIISWSPIKGISVKTQIIPNECGHDRIHTITSDYDCVAYDCGFAIASSDCFKCKTEQSSAGASAKNSFSSCAVIGGDGHIISASPNTNIMYPKTVIPSVRYAIPKGTVQFKTTVITAAV